MPNLILATHVYVVRIWIENLEADSLQGLLRGVVETVPVGERRYFNNLEEMKVIIADFLGRDAGAET